jgi:hypothetical protein
MQETLDILSDDETLADLHRGRGGKLGVVMARQLRAGSVALRPSPLNTHHARVPRVSHHRSESAF